MKIVQIITGSPSFGGAEAHVRDLAVGLRLRGHECVVLVGLPEGLLHDQLMSAGVPFVNIPALRKPIHPVWDMVSLCQILWVFWKLRPDVIATHTSKAGFVGRAAARMMGIPSFFTPHGLSFINRQDGELIPFRLMLEKIALCLGGRQIAVCDAERQLAIRWLSIGEDTISTVHNGVPAMIRSRLNLEERVVITMVARFDVQKDHATLLKALSTLRHLNWKLRLAGDGPLLANVKAMAREYGLSSRIDFMNQCSDIPALLASTDIFVLSSNWEAFPISILEAMRAGLPVIATNTGGVIEAVKDGENGFLVKQHDFTEMATKLLALISSPELRNTMGIKSQSQFGLMFDWRHMLDKTEMLYTSALEGRTRRLLEDSAAPETDGETRRLRPAYSFFSGLLTAVTNAFITAKRGKKSFVFPQSVVSKRSSRLSGMVLFAVDAVCMVAALWLSLLIADLFGRSPNHKVVLQLCVILIAVVLTLALGGLYPALGTTGFVESKRIFKAVSLVQNGMFLCFWIIGAQQYELSSILLFWALSIVFVIFGRSSARTFLSRRSWWGESVLLIGPPDQIAEIAELLHCDQRFGLHVGCLLNEDAEPSQAAGAPVFESLEPAAEFCRQARIQTAIVMLKNAEGLTVSEATSRYSPFFPKLIIFPLIGPRRPSSSRATVLSKHLSIEASLVSLMRSRRHLKRCIDLVLALSASIVLSPLLIAIAIAVKLTSRGPVFFGHRRVGRHGKTFLAWKFRTMVVDAEAHLAARLAESPELRAEWEQYHKLRKDPRITKIGLFLRKYSLDELPQLWNTICSEMSIVGPRPIIADEIAKYSDCFHCYSRVLPGITGLWQVSGRNETSYDERVELDTYYVNSWSLWLDLYIVCRSFTAVFNGRGAY